MVNSFAKPTVLLAALVLLGFMMMIPSTNADLPVHCLYNTTLGTWELSLTAQRYGKQIAQDGTCDIRANIKPVNTLLVRLEMPDVAIDQFGNKGFWTLVYDQGFEVVVNGNKYWAFFNYTTAGKDSQGNDIIVSHCDQTFTGWFHEIGVNAKYWGCYRAKKVANYGSEQYNNASPRIPQLTTKSQQNQNKLVHVSTTNKVDLSGQVFKNDMKKIDQLNEMYARGEITWKAKPMTEWENQPLSSIVPKFGKQLEVFRMKSRREHSRAMKQMYGAEVTKKTILALRNMDLTNYNVSYPYLKDIAMRGVNAIPKAFDWRSLNGENYVSPVRNQGQCGSCYSFASTAMFEARMRVYTKNSKQPIFSPEDVISCSSYSQGCDGGFAYLVSKYGEDYGIAQDQCFPYTAQVESCKKESDTCPPRQYWTDYHYVGGWYGASTEESMMLDIIQHGPLAVSMEVYSDLKNYHSGIYKHVTSMTEAPVPNPFELTNHVVLIVGWGEQNGQKYWIVKNSWGTSFGLEGFFWIAKGVDECAIESENTSAAPVL